MTSVLTAVLVVLFLVSATHATRLSPESQCVICRHVVTHMMEEIYHGNEKHKKIIAHELLATIATKPVPYNTNHQHITNPDVEEFIATITNNRKLDNVLKDLVEYPPSTRRISFSAVTDIFRNSLCIEGTRVCAKADENREL